MKIQLHLMRLINGEFLLFQVTPNQSRFGEQILFSIFMSVYYIEVFTSIMKANPDEDLNHQMRAVTRLVKQVDKLTHKN